MSKGIRKDPRFEAISKRYPLTDIELAELEADIVKRGCIHPVTVWDGALIDGYHRFDICARHKIPIEFKALEFASASEAEWWAWEIMKARRNLSPFSRGEIELKQKEVLAAMAKERQREGQDRGRRRRYGLPGERLRCARCGVVSIGGDHDCKALVGVNVDTNQKTRTKLAKSAGISAGTMHKVEVLAKKAPEEAKKKLRRGETTINREYQAIKTAERKKERAAELAEVSQRNAELPVEDRSYGIIYADPPWRYEHVKTESRAIENQYPTMDLDDICNLPVSKLALDDCVLFLWVTSPKVAEGIRVVDAWGFTYRTCAVWDKGKIGMGYYFRQQHELLFVATRGSPPAPDPANRVPSVLTLGRGKHSSKPPEVYGLIERMYPEDPKIELFARRTRAGWDKWGNQCTTS
jgi:N6-adenosine-specific RNA methylase IME4